MTILSALATDATITKEADTLGGGYKPVDSGIYDLQVKLAYLKPAASGALGLALEFVTSEGSTIRETVYMTSGTAKGGKNYYEKNGKKAYLPGFNTANSLAQLTVGKEIGTLVPEEKVINLYDYDAQKELPTKVQMYTDLIGQTIKAGILFRIEDKNAKNDAGMYVPTGEVREMNVVDKFFRSADSLTTTEILAKALEPGFINKWAEQNNGRVDNKSKGMTGAQAGVTAGAPNVHGAANVAGAAALGAAAGVVLFS